MWNEEIDCPDTDAGDCIDAGGRTSVGWPADAEFWVPDDVRAYFAPVGPVEAHLADHLDRLPEGDARSQAILDQMKVDEARHAHMAEEAGARELPEGIRRAMTFTAGIMKTLAYRV